MENLHYLPLHGQIFLSGLNAKTIFICAFNQKSGLQDLESKVEGELKDITYLIH